MKAFLGIVCVSAQRSLQRNIKAITLERNLTKVFLASLYTFNVFKTLCIEQWIRSDFLHTSISAKICKRNISTMDHCFCMVDRKNPNCQMW